MKANTNTTTGKAITITTKSSNVSVSTKKKAQLALQAFKKRQYRERKREELAEQCRIAGYNVVYKPIADKLNAVSNSNNGELKPLVILYNQIQFLSHESRNKTSTTVDYDKKVTFNGTIFDRIKTVPHGEGVAGLQNLLDGMSNSTTNNNIASAAALQKKPNKRKLGSNAKTLKADARNVRNRDKEMRALERDLARKDEYIASLKADIDDRDVIIAEDEGREDKIALLNDELAAKNKEIALLKGKPQSDQAQAQPKVLSVQLDYEHINCDICKSEYSFDMSNKDEWMRLPVLSSSKSCDHWFCHGCILQQQATLAEDNNGNVPKWIPCMVCRTKTAFCPSEPKYHRMLIGLLKQSKWTDPVVDRSQESTKCKRAFV